MPTIKGTTKAVAEAIIEVVRVTGIIFSRQSLNKKEVLIEFGFDPWKVNKTIRRFEHSGFLKSSGEKLHMTEKGLVHFQRYQLNAIHFEPDAKKWDGVWRLLLFDVPERDKYLRNALRRKLKEWKFKQIQKSVFVTPYDCTKELKELVDLLSIDAYVHIIPTNSMGDIEKNLRSHFGVS